jgi:zinc protease
VKNFHYFNLLALGSIQGGRKGSMRGMRVAVLCWMTGSLLAGFVAGSRSVGAAPSNPVAIVAEPATQTKVAERQLANGMRVFVKTDRRAPVVVSMVWYGVGSVDEVNGRTGLAHVLEHMMFKGTHALPAGEFSKQVSQAGGRENAFTSRDYTAYHETIQSSQLALMLQLEADRMQNALIAPDEFAKEIKVIMEERRWRTDDKPRAQLHEQLMASALLAHPHRTPVVGWMNDLEHLRAEDARDFYSQWYAPNNALLVVVGDVSAQEGFALAEKAFGSIAAKTLPPRRPQEEPQQKGIRRIVFKAPAEQAMLLMAYRAPKIVDFEKDWEPYALDVLSSVLAGSDAARLNRELVRGTEVASAADASYDGLGRGPGFFYFSAIPSKNQNVKTVEAALRAQIKKIIDEGVSAQELQRIRTQVLASRVYERDAMMFQANQIGQMAILGLPIRAIEVMDERSHLITADQVREVAKKYLVDDALTVAELVPLPVTQPRNSKPPVGLRDEK